MSSGAHADRDPKFETPTLRFVSGTAPYFHDGRYRTLRELLVEGVIGQAWRRRRMQAEIAKMSGHVVVAGAGGTINPSGAVSVPAGNNQSFAISASSGFHILDVLVDGASAGPLATYTFTNVQANHTIAASFAASPASRGSQKRGNCRPS